MITTPILLTIILIVLLLFISLFFKRVVPTLIAIFVDMVTLYYVISTRGSLVVDIVTFGCLIVEIFMLIHEAVNGDVI